MFDELSNFSFPTKITFGSGSIRELPAVLAEHGARKPLIVTDPGLRASGVVDTVTGVLRDAGIAHEVFDRVHGNPIEEDVTESAALYRAAGCDASIGLGGGSALDVSKAVVVLARYDGPLADLEWQAGGMAKMTGPYDPIIAIPTTS
ncbi:MAG: iron-containing alcohol dehydrogenase, partial [Candidatus Solibacter sp.]